MRVEAHNNFQDIRKFDATRLVVYDSARNPIAIVVQLSPDLHVMSIPGQPDFEDLCRQMGIATNVVVDIVQQADPKKLTLL